MARASSLKLIFAARARAQPLRQAREFDRPHGQPDAAFLQRLHPTGVLRVAIEPAGDDEQQQVIARGVNQPLQHGAPGGSRLSGRQPHLDQTTLREQRQRLSCLLDLFPDRARALDEENLAFGEPGHARTRTDLVGRLANPQGFITRYQPGAGQPTFQLRGQILERQFHQLCSVTAIS